MACGNAARSEGHLADLANASVGEEQRIVDTEIAFEGRAIIQPKKRRDEGNEAKTGHASEGRYIVCHTIRRRRNAPPTALSGRLWSARRRLEHAPTADQQRTPLGRTTALRVSLFWRRP